MQSLLELDWDLEWFSLLIKANCLPDVIHDYLARIAAGHVLLELLADPGIYSSIHVFVQHS